MQLFVFLSVFAFLSVLTWTMAFFPALKEAVKKFQLGLNAIFASPVLGLALLCLVFVVYFPLYVSNGLDNFATSYTNKFTFFWIISVGGVALFTAVLKLYQQRV